MTAPRVLVLDDDDALRTVLVEALTAAGYYAVPLDAGAGALDSLRAQRPDLLVLDLVMPPPDGLQVLAALRALGHTLPVLMVTALPLTDPRLAGASAFLRKPFDLDVFLRTVARVLGVGAA